MSAYSVLLRKDARIVLRDRLLVVLCSYALLIALVLRWTAPLIPVDQLGLYVAPMVILFSPQFLGTVLGFALIEEREQGTWLLLRVLPLRASVLVSYLGAVSIGASALMGALAALAYGRSVSDALGFALMLGASATTGPAMMLALGAFARNKIEGLALSKILSFLGFFPALVFVLPPAWQPLLWWNPFYWLYVGLLEVYAASPAELAAPLHWPGIPVWICALAASLLSLAAVIGLARRYRRVAE